MKAPVLVFGPRTLARSVCAALQPEFTVAFEEDPSRARAFAATGAHLAVIAIGGVMLDGGIELEPSAEPTALVAAVATEIARAAAAQQVRAREDDVGVLAYDDFLELVRYAMTRRYLASLLDKHRGSVTDAARGAGLKRESLHRLLRRHHMVADDFRAR